MLKRNILIKTNINENIEQTKVNNLSRYTRNMR